MTVTIRPLSLGDVTDDYVAWMQDPVVTRDLVSGLRPQTRDTIEAFVRSLAWPSAAAFAVCLDGRHVGNVNLRAIDWIHRHAEVGILIGDRTVWHRGVASTAVILVIRYARFLGLRRLWAGTCGEPARDFFLHLGWSLEGVQRQHMRINGAWRDHYLFGLQIEREG